MKEPAFDIFSGGPDNDPLWIEAVEGLAHARERLEQIALQKPGQYFLFSFRSQSVLTRVETFHRTGSAKAKGRDAA